MKPQFLSLLFAACAAVSSAWAQGTAFTYQGRLNAGGTAVTGSYDFTFALFNNSSTNTGQVGATLTNLAVGVTGGLFSVTLDFGANYPGASRWLAMAVRTNGATGFTPLSPLQPLTPAPYAVYAANAGTATAATSATGFSGTLAGDVTGAQGATVVATVGGQTAASVASGASAANGATSANTANTHVKRDGTGNFGAGTITASFAGNGVGVTNLNAAQLATGVIPLTVLPGFQSASNYTAVGGGNGNTVGGTAATIAGGLLSAASTNYTAIGGGVDNLASGIGAVVAGGMTNAATGVQATVAGGEWNWASNLLATVSGGSSNLAGGLAATVAGGSFNGAMTNYDTVGGGLGNYAYGPGAVIAGGVTNTATALEAVIGGGERNLASGALATIAGGYNNLASGVEAAIAGGEANLGSGTLSAVGGGYGNVATNYAATIPGGYGNVAGGLYSFAAGAGALAVNDGAFVWADESTTNVMRSTVANQFTARCAGGVRFFSNPLATLGVVLAPGGNAWSQASDRNLKENFKPIDTRAILARLVATPVTEWNLMTQDPAIRHIGPMAQDFKAAFGVGEDDRHISSTDADGVAFAAIQGLYLELRDRDARIARLEERLQRLEAKLGQPSPSPIAPDRKQP